MSLQNTNLDISRYSIISKIGEGGFSKVFRIKDLKTGDFCAAKISKLMVDEETKESQETLLLFREVNLMSLLNHPSILKFIGYYSTNFENEPTPTIITEIAVNGSLRDIINLEASGLSPDDWDDTKKLICIYGIAAGMNYLHSHNVLHRDLKPENILMDDYLYPKISDFGLSKITDFLSASMNIQSQNGLKGTPAYMAPEILSEEKYSKSGDVYSFAFIVYEILNGEFPFEKFTLIQLMKKVMNEGYRPTIKEDVSNAFKELIEKCWSQNPDERPSFNDIVEELKGNGEFISDMVDVNEFYDYIDFIDNFKSTFDVDNRLFHFDDFIKSRGRNKTLKTISIKKIEEVSIIQSTNEEPTNNERPLINEELRINSIPNDDKVLPKIIEDKVIESNQQKIIESQTEFSLYPQSEFIKLSKKCQDIVTEANNNPEKQFIVGKSLIEGKEEFPKNTDLGLKYIEQSISHKFTESIIYYVKLLIKGKIIPSDLQKAAQYLSKISSVSDYRVLVLKGKICIKENKFSEATKYFEKGVKEGNGECMYQYAKMLFLGNGITKNMKEAFKYFIQSKDNGYEKSNIFLDKYSSLSTITGFTEFPAETQLFLVSNSIKNYNKNIDKNHDSDLDQIFIIVQKTEMLYYNKSLKSKSFISFLKKYKNISIEIDYPSKSFTSLYNLISKIKSKEISNLIFIIVFKSFPVYIFNKYISKNVSYCTIHHLYSSIPDRAFHEVEGMKKMIIPSSITSIGEAAFAMCTLLTYLTIPSSVYIIGDKAFAQCNSIRTITIPSSVTSIGKRAFWMCDNLREISLSSSLREISNETFFMCKSLEQICIPSSVSVIGHSAFSGCDSLKSVIFEEPSSLKKIENCAFACKSLSQLSFPSSVTFIHYSNFSCCDSLKQITIPFSLDISQFKLKSDIKITYI